MISCFSSLITLFVVVHLSNATCTCKPLGTSCSQGYTKTCENGTVYCNYLEITSGTFELTKACITTNGGITPKIRIRGVDIYLNLEQGVYHESEFLVFYLKNGGASVHLIGDYRVDLFGGFNLWSDNNFIYFENETVFENHDWTIKYGTTDFQSLDFIFNKQATFNNFSLTVVDDSKTVFNENVKFQTGSTLNLLSGRSLQSYKLFECDNSNVNIDSIRSFGLNQTEIKSSSNWNIKGNNTNSYCINTIEVSNSNVTFEDNSIMNCCFNSNDINSYFVIRNNVTCCLSRYESEKNIIIGNENRITVDLLVIKNENDVGNLNQFIPKRCNLYNSVSVTIDSTNTKTTFQNIELNDNSKLIINGITITIQELKCNGNGILKVINGATLTISPKSFNFYDSCQLIVEDSTLSKPFINFYDNSTLILSNSFINMVENGKEEEKGKIIMNNNSTVNFEETFKMIINEETSSSILFSTYDESQLIFKNGYQSNGIISNQQWNDSSIIIEDNCQVELTTIYYQDINTNLIVGLNSNLKLEYLTINGSDIESINLNEKVTYKGYYLIGDYELNVNETNEYEFIGGEGNVNVNIEYDLECYFRTNNKTNINVNGSNITNTKYSILNFTDISFINDASLFLNKIKDLYHSIISFKESHLDGNSQIRLFNSSVIFEGNCQIEGNPSISFNSLPAIMTIKDKTIINKNCLGITGNVGTIIIGNYSYVYLCSLDDSYWNKIKIGTDSLLRLKSFQLQTDYL